MKRRAWARARCVNIWRGARGAEENKCRWSMIEEENAKHIEKCEEFHITMAKNMTGSWKGLLGEIKDCELNLIKKLEEN